MSQALVTKHVTRIRRIILLSVPPPPLPGLYYTFPHYLVNGTTFGKRY